MKDAFAEAFLNELAGCYVCSVSYLYLARFNAAPSGLAEAEMRLGLAPSPERMNALDASKLVRSVLGMVIEQTEEILEQQGGEA